MTSRPYQAIIPLVRLLLNFLMAGKPLDLTQSKPHPTHMMDDKTKKQPDPKSKPATDQKSTDEPEIVEQAKEFVEKGKAKSRKILKEVCDDLKEAKDVTARKSGSWLNSAFKAIESSAGKIVKKTDKAAKEERKAAQAAERKKKDAQAKADSTSKAKKAPADTQSKQAVKKKTAKKAVKKKTAKKKTTAKKAAKKKTAGPKKKAAKAKSAKKTGAAPKPAAKKSSTSEK